MTAELSLVFPDEAHVQVRLRDGDNDPVDSPPQPFAPPLDEEIGKDLTWYLETYPVSYTTEEDDVRAAATEGKLKEWGTKLFETVFASHESRGLFNRFQENTEAGRLLTIRSPDPTILGQPWELLCDPRRSFLFLDHPRISIRRRLPGDGTAPHRPKPKDAVHMLFIVSRPADAGLIDPRADPMAVLEALDDVAPGRVGVEFLRPPTLKALIARLDDDRKPPVDILHFDGHGAYDPDGQLSDRARQAIAAGGAGHLLKEAPAGGHKGYLVFEEDSGKSAFVPASILGDLLQSKRVGLVILSACQSAKVGGTDPLGSVAPRLIDAGLPSVLAMTQSVLVPTTKALFGHFYRDLAAGRAIGAALDHARAQLYGNRIRGEHRRAAGNKPLDLQDWFVPALYQAGADGPLLKQGADAAPPLPAPGHNLPPAQESGFHGRTGELWRIERWFVQGTRRIVLTGFGGQGKTTLAEEAGRWLWRTGMFERVCICRYAGYQGSDAVQMLLSTLSTVLSANLQDTAAAEAALRTTRTLLILDNLESLDAAARHELLSAATGWSAQGGSRVLLTARPDDLKHPDFPTEGSRLCRYLSLDGLHPTDALGWFQALLTVPPEPIVPVPQPAAIEDLFRQVRFHPLSIGVLTQLLKRQRIADVAEALRERLRRDGDCLRASLDLSLARLGEDVRAALPGLGIFVDGAFEPVLREVLDLDEPRWARLRDGLRRTGLAIIEPIAGVDAAFIRFHPSLAPAMRESLTREELARLGETYRRAYYQLSGELYRGDSRNPDITRAIARRDLPNLRAAAFAALDQGDPEAADFANNVGLFLTIFGLARDRAALQARARSTAGAPGSESWYLARSNSGEHLYALGRFAEAAAEFREILRHLGSDPSHRRVLTLAGLARCERNEGGLEPAEATLRCALQEVAHLSKDRDSRGLEGLLHTDLGDVLLSRGDLDNAETEHQRGIEISEELDDERGVAVGKGQLGSIYLERGELTRAAQSYHEAIGAFERLEEPRSIAIAYHQLGNVYHEARDWPKSEQAYRESARIKESIPDRLGAAQTRLNLAVVLKRQGRPVIEVEPWYRKALAVFDAEAARVFQAMALNNLADLLQSDPARLAEAGALAEQALAIRQTIDPATAEIWKTYGLLAEIAEKRGDAAAARRYRAESRQSFAAAPIARVTLDRHRPLIGAVLVTLSDPLRRTLLENILTQGAANGRGRLVAALRALLDGEREEETLCAALDREDALIVQTILDLFRDPAAAEAFFAAPS